LEAALATEEKQIAFVCQRIPQVENPVQADLFAFGTTGTLMKKTRTQPDQVQVVVTGSERIGLMDIRQHDDYFVAEVYTCPLTVDKSAEVEAMSGVMVDLAKKVLEMSESVPQEALSLLNVEDPLRTAYTVASLLGLETEKKQAILEAPTVLDLLNLMREH